MDPATAIVIGTLEPTPLVWRWVRRAISAGAEIVRPRTGVRSPRFAVDDPVDLTGFERVDALAAPVTGNDVLVMLVSRTGDHDGDLHGDRATGGHGAGAVAGLSGDELVVLLPADGGRAAAEDSAEAGRAWVALVSLAGRPRNTTAFEPLVREATARRDATAIRRSARPIPRTGCAPAPAARPDRGLSARATFARTGPFSSGPTTEATGSAGAAGAAGGAGIAGAGVGAPRLVLVGGRDVRGRRPVR